jgi:ADP-ribose pyrophosphatase YjhB (NUDIX family)
MTWVPPEEFFKTVPKKWSGAATLFFNSENKILLVKPNYKDKWLPVGGLIESGESPTEAAKREAKEEINIDPTNLKLLCVEYHQSEDAIGDRFQFLFDGGILNEQEIASIKLPPDEIAEFGFFTLEESVKMLAESNKERIETGIKARELGTILYAEREF